jgi:uncharacterized protein (DUF1697 family)
MTIYIALIRGINVGGHKAVARSRVGIAVVWSPTIVEAAR